MFVCCWDEENGRRSSVVCRATFGNVFGRVRRGKRRTRALSLLAACLSFCCPLSISTSPAWTWSRSLLSSFAPLSAPSLSVSALRLAALNTASSLAARPTVARQRRRRAPGSAIKAHAPSADAEAYGFAAVTWATRATAGENTASSAEAIREAARS